MNTRSFCYKFAALATSSIMFFLTIFVSLHSHAGVEIAPDGTCLVSGSSAYGAYMRPGYAIDPCAEIRTKSVADADAVRRATCPEMWATVTNVSDSNCRDTNDRRNIRHAEAEKGVKK